MKNEFETQLTTAILSMPIVYIPHFHYHLLDDSINNIINPKNGRCVIRLSISDNVIEYDCGQQCVIDFKKKTLNDDLPHYTTPTKLLKDYVIGKYPRTILVFKNFCEQLQNEEVQSLLSLFASKYENGDMDKLCTIIVMSPLPITALPKEVSRFVSVIEINAPSQEEILDIVKKIPISERYKSTEDELRLDLCHTLQGLQIYEVNQILNSALIRTGGFLSVKTKLLALEEKKNIVRKSGIVEVIDADINFEQIGGLKVLKEDLKRKGVIYRNLSQAQKCRIALPKGILIIGMPGCGKSMIAKSIANEFGVSLLRLDVNRLMGQYVGQSEANLRYALATAEAAHPCVLWIDEIEKAFAGSNGQNSDMLVMRLMGHFLTWMQERKTPVYIVATANDVMRPEFMRRGRFDEVYFVDFPNEEERKQILIKKIEPFRNKKDGIFDFSAIKKEEDIVKEMKGKFGGFSGAEIESIVNTVIEKKFVDYIEATNKNKKPTVVMVTEQDFKNAINTIKDSVLSNQELSISGILKMQDTYKFKCASEKKGEKK